MSVSEATVRALADQVADLVKAWIPQTTVGVRIEPYPGGGRDMAGVLNSAWTVYFDIGSDRSDSVAVWVPQDEDSSFVLFRLVDALDEISETGPHRGEAFPRCVAGHSHPAEIRVDGGGVVFLCAKTGEISNRIPLPGG